jgi:hypothetical protein
MTAREGGDDPVSELSPLLRLLHSPLCAKAETSTVDAGYAF